jgi:isatin hydrolase
MTARLLEGVRVVDLSVPVAPEYPVWPGNPPVVLETLRSYDEGHFNRVLSGDEHIGTHWDAPAHFIPDPETQGLWTSEGIALDRLVVPAAVLDACELVGQGEAHISPKVTRERIVRWENDHGALAEGDALLLRTDWTDRYYRAAPEGRAYAEGVLAGELPPWPGLTVDAMQHIADRGVILFGTDTPSAGPLDTVVECHVAALSRNLVVVENLIGLGQLPTRGALFCFLPLKIVGGSGAPGRAVGFVTEDLYVQVDDRLS